MRLQFRVLFLGLLVASLSLLACDLGTLGLAQASKPTVTIQSPAAGGQFHEGDEVSVQSTSNDSSGIVRVELGVDGATVRTDAPPIPQGQVSFSLIQKWVATPGTHTISVRAYNTSGAASDPALVSITVAAGAPTPVATATTQVVPSPLGSTPTLSAAEATPSRTPTRRPPTKIPASPTPSAPPGVWATGIQPDPAKGTRGYPVTFRVTFLNTTGLSQAYRWRVRIYTLDNMKNSFGDTAPLSNDIPVGASTLASSDNWKVTGPGDCVTYRARVFWIDPESKQESEFLKPDQSGGPAADFQVCP